MSRRNSGYFVSHPVTNISQCLQGDAPYSKVDRGRFMASRERLFFSRHNLSNERFRPDDRGLWGVE